MFGETAYNTKQGYGSAPLEEQLEALRRAVQAGKVLHVGLSNETPWGLMECCRLGGSPEAFGDMLRLAFMRASDWLFQVYMECCQGFPVPSQSAAIHVTFSTR